MAAFHSIIYGRFWVITEERKIGGIMAEYGEDDSVSPLSSFRYYM